MLEFSWRDGGDWDAAVLDYFASGERVAATVLQVARAWFGDLDHLGSLLDFGGGYGRVTRFFAAELGPQRVSSSDLLPGAVAFARSVLGVGGFVSSVDPADLRPPRRYDLIYAGSLFTHQPSGRFDRWLERLLAMLEPDGLLVFSVHGEELLPPEHEMPSEGFFFEPSSESHELDHAEYGSSWITGPALRRRLEGVGAVHRLLPRGLCGYQDLVLATASAAVTADGDVDGRRRRMRALPIDPGARCQIESCTLSVGRRAGREAATLVLELSGWAIPGAADTRVESIAVLLADPPDGQVQSLGTLDAGQMQPREELVEPLDLDAAARPGWSLRVALPVPLRRTAALLVVEVATGPVDRFDPVGPPRADEALRTVVWAGALERLLHHTARENFLRHRQRVYELAEIIEAMKQSFFWRLRRRWFQLKRAAGMTEEDPDGPPITATDRRPPGRARAGTETQEGRR